jgi:hypothetical protein
MDDTIKMMLNSYETGLQNYSRSLGDNNPVIIKAFKCLEELKKIGDSCADINAFSVKTTALLPEMSKHFMDLSNEKPVNKVAPQIPSAQQIAQAYHIANNSITNKENSPETCKVYERVFELEKQAENGIHFMRLITEENLTVKMSSYGLMETSVNLLDGELKKISLPQMMIYHKNVIREMKDVKSVAEIEYYSNIRSDISYYENQWDMLFCIMTYVNLSSAISSFVMAQTEENRQGVEYSYRFLAKYFGINYDELMALPRIRDYFEKMVWVTVKEKYIAGGIDTPEKYFELDKQYLMQCIQGRAPIEFGGSEKRNLSFFGKKYHMHNDIPALYEKAPHPDDK